MTQIDRTNNIQSTQETQNTSTVGKLGKHTVQIGNNPPVSLNEIKGNKIPFAGFRTATKIINAKTGARDNATYALKALSSNDGKLDLKGLLNGLKTLQSHLDRLQTLGEIHCNMDSAVLCAFAYEIESLSNEELLNVYKQLYTKEISLLKKALQQEITIHPNNADAKAILANLALLDALVTQEAGNRIALEQGLASKEEIPSLTERYGNALNDMGEVHKQENPNDMSATSMQVLINVNYESSLRTEKAEKIAEKIITNRNIENINPKDFGDVLRSTELTTNIDLGFFFGISGSKPLLKAGGTWEHLFHAIESAPDEETRKAAINVKGAGYIQKRDQVERTFFHEFDNHVTKAKDRPTYAAMNISQLKTGAVGSYGGVSLHLKPEVSRRATYTVNDSFINIHLKYTDKGKEALLALLPNFSEIAPEHRAAMIQDGTELNTQLSTMLDTIADMKEFRGDSFRSILSIPGLTEDENTAMAGLIIKCFNDAKTNRSIIATYDNLETLLPELKEEDAVNLARAALEKQQNGTGKLTCSSNYIEAQIHGPLVLARDVANISINKMFFDILPPEQKDWILAQVAALQGKKTNKNITLSSEQQKELATIKEQLGGVTIPVTFEDEEIEIDIKNNLRIQQDEFYAQHFDQTIFNTVLTDIQDNTKFNQLILDNLVYIPSGRNIQSILHDNQLVPDETLLRLKENFTAKVEQFRNAPLNEQKTEDMLITSCIKMALEEIVGKDRLQSLDVLALLTENPKQQTILKNFIINHPPMNAEVFKAFASSALQVATIFDNTITQQENPLSDTEFISKLGNAISSFRKVFQALPKNIQEATNEDIFLQSYGQLALSLTNSNSSEAQLILAERLNSQTVQSVISVLQLLSDPMKGLINDPCFMDIKTFNALQRSLYNTLAEKVHTPAPFTKSLALIPTETRKILHNALPEIANTLNTSFPLFPAFPTPTNADILNLTPSQHRDFLLSMLPMYHEHEQEGGFDYGTAYHGRGHICRTFIFASTMAGIMENMGHNIDRTALLCGIVGHDSGRSHNGADNEEMETKSAKNTLTTMKSLYGEDSLGKEYEKELTSSIVNHASPTIESMILNSADSLDIGRVKDFDYKYLPILRGGKQEDTCIVVPEYQAIRKQLHEEADLLARMTDPMTQTRDLLFSVATEENGMELMAEISNGRKTAIIEQSKIGNEEFLAFVEDKIQTYPDMFPLLNKYYLKPLRDN